jgi:hypothetical protein
MPPNSARLACYEPAIDSAAARCVADGLSPTICTVASYAGLSIGMTAEVIGGMRRGGRWPYPHPATARRLRSLACTDGDTPVPDDPDEEEVLVRARAIREGWDERRWASASGMRVRVVDRGRVEAAAVEAREEDFPR